MLKLIYLEWKKHALWKYIRNAVIVTAALGGLLLLISSDAGTGSLVAQTGKSEIHSLTEMFLNMACLVFTGTMLSTFVVSEYENKLICLLFSYPIRRRKLMAAKVLAVCIFNFAALLASKLAVYGVLLAVRGSEALGLGMGEPAFWLDALLGGAVSVCSGCISLWVGLRLRSSRASLVGAFVVMLVVMGVTQGNILPCASLMGGAGYAAQLLLAAAAVGLATCRLETEDVS